MKPKKRKISINGLKEGKKMLRIIFDGQSDFCISQSRKGHKRRKAAREFFKKLKTDIEKGDKK